MSVDPSGPVAPVRYALLEQIGSGGMASVSVGRLLGPAGFSRTVAIKRMLPGVANDPEFISMFLDEARLAARIQHPNVVQTLDIVTTGPDIFIVMEYVRGESLSRLLQAVRRANAKIPYDIAVTIMTGVLHGLHAAHEAKDENGKSLGIVHRDVSPHNILVGVDGVSRVLDFGVAKAVDRLQTTRSGRLKGKIAYMAPEQVEGAATRASDIYAASIVLWEALTGRRLFEGENEAQVLVKVMRGCTEGPETYTPELPASVVEATLRGLSVDPAARFATAHEMARALEDALPVVPASKIGEWVATIAKETLEARSERIALMEKGALDRPGDARIETATATLVLTGVSVSSPPPAVAPPTPSRVNRTAILGICLLLLAVLVGWRWPRSSDSAETTSPSAVGATLPPPPVTTSTASSTGEIASAASAAPSAPSSVTARTTRRTAPPRSAATTAPAPAPGTCDPPFYYDARGLRIFKKECM